MRDVAPGEAVFIDLDGSVHARQCAEHPTLNPCMFEFVYLARPDSVMDGMSVYQARLNMGETLAQRVISTMPPIEIDVVIPIPESSRPVGHAAGAEDRQAVSRGLRQEPLRRPHLHHAGAGACARSRCARSSTPSCMEFKGRNVLLVDDSIVRGTTSKEIVQMAREAGARKVYMASAAPPVRYPERVRHRHADQGRADRARPQRRGDPPATSAPTR